ncbi:MAG: amino acid adenylation domain-containing protein, partial [Cyclobacteriaceae bacterium]
MNNLANFFNNLRHDSGAIWLENDSVVLSAPKKYQTQETKELIQNNKDKILKILRENSILSEKDFQQTVIFKDHTVVHYPLSPAQERLWFIDQYEEGTNAYNVPSVFELHEETDVKAIKNALVAVVDRHEILRSTIDQRDDLGYDVQKVHNTPLTIDEKTVDSFARASAEIIEYVNQPFDLRNNYPIRAGIYSIRPNDESESPRNLLVITIHHIASDGWSRKVFTRELLHFYQADLKGEDNSLAPLSIQYKDYASWQRSFLKGDLLNTQLAYWENKIAGFQTLELPTDFPRPAKTDYRGASKQFRLSEETSQKLRKLAQTEGVTLNSVMLSTFNVLLGKYTGQEDIVTGSPSANRHYRQVQDLIGFFINTQANRTILQPGQTFTALIHQVHKDQVEAQLRQDLPFERLVDELNVERDASRHPIFQVIFEVQGFTGKNETTDKEILSYCQIDQIFEIERFDLSVFINDDDEKLLGHISYATSLFAPETIAGLIKHYIYLLELLVGNPAASYSDISLLHGEEKALILNQWSGEITPLATRQTVVGMIEAQAHDNPEAIAVTDASGDLTYRELNQLTDNLAGYLTSQYNINKDEPVGIMLERSSQTIIAMIAVMKAGGAYVSIDIEYPETRKSYIATDAGLNVLITASDYMFDVSFFTGNLFAIDLQLESLPAPEKSMTPDVTEDHLAYVIYTSGTTGQPKGVMIRHESVVNYIYNLDKVLLPGIQNVDFSTNTAFDLTVTTTIAALALGKTICVYEGSLNEADLYLKHLADRKIDFLKGTPSFLASLPVEDVVPFTIKQAFIGGEKLEKPQLDKILKFVSQPVDEYGPTETTVGATFIIKDHAEAIDSIGRPYANYKLYVLDKYQQPVPAGVAGELYIAGKGLAKGYLNKPELTKERFMLLPLGESNADIRVYRTGDLVRWLPTGQLQYLHRNDEQVKIRGFRIELAEIDHALSAIAGIDQACTIARERKAGDPSTRQLIAYYITQEEGITAESIKEEMQAHIPGYMIPSVFISLEEFPLTTNGKLDKKALPDPEVNQEEVAYLAPESELEMLIADIWKDVLGIERISINENFFSIGGDSILSIQISSKIRQAGYPCQVKDIFENKTVAGLAEYLKRNSHQVKMLQEQGDLSGDFDLLPIQQWFFDRKEQGELPKYNHWNQSFLIKTSDIKANALSAIVSKLVSYHDALRLQFIKIDQVDGKPQWKQVYRKEIAIPEVKVLDVSQKDDSEIRETLTSWQSDFDIENGPLFQVGLLEGIDNEKKAIYFALHHLIIDTVSWRIIAEDLKTLYAGGELPAKGTSYRQWSEQLSRYVDNYPEEIVFWNDQLQVENRQAEENLSNPATSISIALDRDLTGKLLQEAPQAYHTEVNDLLLTAFAYALQELNTQQTQLITLEGHGREEIAREIDHSRTVGWFTTMYPVKLEVGDDYRSSIRKVKKSLRSIPRKGLGFGALAASSATDFNVGDLPSIVFNYLGQLENKSTGEWQLEPADSIGIHPDNADYSSVKVSGMVHEGQMQFQIVTKYGEKNTALLAEKLQYYLTELTKHCIASLATDGATYTPEDFTTVDISQKLISRLEAEARENKNAIRQILPANSLQQGFIYHVITRSKDDAYRVQVLFDYHEALDVDLYTKAWEKCILQFPSLRAAFNWDEEMVQVIYAEGILHLTVHDISSLSTQQEKDQAIHQIQMDDREAPFELHKPTQLRIHVIRQANDHYTILKTEH